MIQPDSLTSSAIGHIVNIASVPHRSLFRYPGGKTWLVPRIRNWMYSHKKKPNVFVEPFVGGGIVSLSVAFEDLADQVVMVELDDEVSSVWKTLLYGDTGSLIKKVLEFEVNLPNVIETLAKQPECPEDLAFKTLLKNRTFHGGILAPGSAPIKNGENGRGLKSRWYPETLSKRIKDIERKKNKLEFIQGDGLSYLRRETSNENAVFFIDPPYTASAKKAGTRLYKHNILNHEELFEIVSQLKGDFLMTYDFDSKVIELADRHGFDMHPISMNNTHHSIMTELLIGKDLSWAKSNGLVLDLQTNGQ